MDHVGPKMVAFASFVSKATAFLDKLEGDQGDGKKKCDKSNNNKNSKAISLKIFNVNRNLKLPSPENLIQK